MKRNRRLSYYEAAQRSDRHAIYLAAAVVTLFIILPYGLLLYAMGQH